MIKSDKLVKEKRQTCVKKTHTWEKSNKNVNFDEKKSPHNEKRHRNVNLGDKKWQSSVRKT